MFRCANPRYDEDSLPPLGLGYIATYLRENGIDVTVIDAIAAKTPLQELIDYLDKEQPDFIGINICLLYTSPSPRDRQKSRMPSSA